MGRLTQWSYRHPHKVLAALGGIGAFILGLANLGVVWAFVAALIAVGFTLAIDTFARIDPVEGAHQ